MAALDKIAIIDYDFMSILMVNIFFFRSVCYLDSIYNQICCIFILVTASVGPEHALQILYYYDLN